MKLSSVVNRINGNVDRFTTDLMYYIGGEHFESNELAITKKGLLKENLNILGFKFHFAFQERDVIFMARNPHLRKAGMVMFSGLCSDASYILRSKDENVLTQEFLAVQLQSDHFWDYCESHKVGSVNFANNWSSIANYEFDLPPIEVQRKIGEKVWAAYRVKESYKKLLAATDDMLKAKFMEMFGEEGETISYGDLFYDDTRHATKIVAAEYKQEGKYAIYDQSSDKVICGYTDMEDGVCCDYPTILFGDHSRIIKYIDTPFFIGADGVKIIRPLGSTFIIKFAYYMLKYYNIPNTGYNRHYKYLQAAKFLCPPLSLQQQFVEIATQAEATKESLRKSIENIDQVIKSLINQ